MPVWLRAILFIVVMPGAIGGWLPLVIGGPVAPPSTARQWAGVVVLAAGWALLLWCARDFATRGRGTLSPTDPPRALVTAGFYRYTRNPMYVGVLAAILGFALWLGSRGVLVYGAFMALVFQSRVLLFEEPTLRRVFGAEYEAYCARVPRWLPRP
jgi:protein-S-isoprenylcysteine O-methyltransferase Ste14